MSEGNQVPQESANISGILDILVAEDVLTLEHAQRISIKASDTGMDIADYLIQEKIVSSPKELLRYVAKAINAKFVDLSDLAIDKSLAKVIKVEVAKGLTIVPIHQSGSKISFAVPLEKAMDLNLNDQLRRATKSTFVEFFAASTDEIVNAINDLYRVDEELTKIADEAAATSSAENSVDSIKEDEVIVGESNVERFVRFAILQGIIDRASDIVFEARENSLALRYRIDGVFHEKKLAPKAIADEIVSVIKLKSELDISIRKKAQDGRMFVMHDGNKVSLRVNIFPIQDGENVTMRVLDDSQANLELSDLGFSPENLKRFRTAIRKPYGMILVTGPTGSGKSVTLYSGLKEIAHPGVNTLTIEDPIEYRVPHVKQSQLNIKQGWTYPEAIRAFMRAAPNNILVGEIRDLDTASTALQAGMTGHLVLSTLHTNTSSEVPARLMDLGVQPHIISSTLTAMVAQRLIRRLCKCKVAYTPTADELLAVDFSIKGKKWEEGDELPTLYKPKEGGCKECSHIGFRGRTAAHEVLLVDEKIRSLIGQKSPASEIEAAAISEGMTKMIEDGWEKVMAGITTIPEVLKSISM